MDLVQLSQAINSYYQGYDAPNRQELETNLKMLENEPDQHLENIMKILHDNQSFEIQECKLTVAIYLRNYIRQLLNRGLQSLQASEIQNILSQIYQTLVSPSIEFQVKKHITLAFESLLSVYASIESDPQKIQEFYSNLFSSVQNQIQNDNIEATKGVLLVCQTALSNIRPLSLLNKMFGGISTLLCKLADHYISILTNELMVISATNSAQLTLDNPSIQKVIASLDLLQQWVNVHESILERYETKKYFAFHLFTGSNQYAIIFTQIIGIIVQTPTQDMQCFISVTGIEKLDQLLNKVKIKTLQCLNYMYKYLFEEVPNQTKLESPITGKAITLGPYYIQTLLSICKRPDILDLINDETYQDLIVETIESLVLFSGEKEFQEMISINQRDIVINVCFNLMRTSASEMETMINDPDQFVTLSLDLCDKQKSRIPKTHAAKLLEAMCDSINGAVSFVTLFCCQALNQALNKGQIEVDENLSIDFTQYVQTSFLQSNPETITETCLIVLTTIAYVLPRRQDLVPIFDSVLANNIDQLLSESSIIVRCRMSLLLGYYADMLFQKYNDAFMKAIEFLFKSVTLTKHEKVIALQSADTLNTIITDKDLLPRLSSHVPQIVSILVECNQKISIMLYFNFLKNFVKFYQKYIGQHIIVLNQSIVQRILSELKLCHEKNEKNNIVINKCWNIIRQIIELPAFIPAFYDQIEEQLKPLFEFILDPLQVEFDDEIVMVIKSFIQKKQSVSPTLWHMFPHLYKVFEKSKFVFNNLLDTLNYFLIYGKDTFAQNREYLSILIEIAKKSLFSTQPSITVQNAEGAILLQIILQIFQNTQVVDEFLDDILNATMNRLTTEPMQTHLKRHLLCVFLSSMSYNPNFTVHYLEKMGVTEQIFNQILQLSNSFTNSYERKLFILGLSNVLHADHLPPVVVNNLLKVIKEIIEMLKNLQENEAKAHVKEGKKEIRRSGDDEEEEDEDDSDDEDYEDYNDEDDDDDDEDSEDEDEDLDNNDEESKGQATEQMIDQTEEAKEAKFALSKEDHDTDDEDDDDDEDEKDELFDLNVAMDLLKTPMRKVDEFDVFHKVMLSLQSKDAVYINNLVAQLNEKEKKILQHHMQTKRIEIEQKGQKVDVPRRLIKVKRRGPVAGIGSGLMGSDQQQNKQQ